MRRRMRASAHGDSPALGRADPSLQPGRARPRATLTTPQTVTSEGDHQCPGGHPSLIHSSTLHCLPDIEDSTWPSVHGDVCVAITWTPKALSEWCAGRCGGADRYRSEEHTSELQS